MKIFIKTNGSEIEMEGGIDFLEFLSKNNIDYIKDENIEKAKEDCFVSIINLSMFQNKYINLQSAFDLGLSYCFNMLTIALVDPNNNELKDELERFKVIMMDRQSIKEILELNNIIDKLSVIFDLRKIEERKILRRLIFKQLQKNSLNLIRDH